MPKVDYKAKQKANLNLVQVIVDGQPKMIPRHRACHKPVVAKEEVELNDGTKVTKTILRTQKAGYIVDETTGTLCRINKVSGKKAKQERKRLRDLDLAKERPAFLKSLV